MFNQIFYGKFLIFSIIVEIKKKSFEFNSLANEIYEYQLSKITLCPLFSKLVSKDETMVVFRGRVIFRFYMPAKPNKWGFKFHSLVENRISYYYDLIFIKGNYLKN